MTVTICIADKESRVRHGLRVFLEQHAGWKVLGEAVDAQELLGLASRSCPELVLLDWGLPGMPAETILPLLRQACPGLRVIAMSGRVERPQFILENGIDAFVSKTESPEKLIGVIQQLISSEDNQTSVVKPVLRESEASDGESSDAIP